MLDSPDMKEAEPRFLEERPRLILEIGPAGSLTADLPGMRKFFDETEANYLAVDPDPRADFATLDNKPWASFIRDNVLNIDTFDGTVDEVWTRNPSRKSVTSPESALPEIIKKASKLLSENGLFVYENTYNPQSNKEEEEQEIKRIMQEAGLEITDLSTHPFVENLDRFDPVMRSSDRIVVIGKKPQQKKED